MSDENNSIKLNNKHSNDIAINVINDHSYRYDKLDLINLGICLLVYMIFCFVGGVQERVKEWLLLEERSLQI